MGTRHEPVSGYGTGGVIRYGLSVTIYAYT